MIVQVIPNLRMPRRSMFFDYCVSSDMVSIIKPGMIVQIPWRRYQITGVIYKITPSSKFKNLKNITNFFDLTVKPWQLKLIPWLAEYYGVSWSAAAHVFLPEPLKNKIKITQYIPVQNFFYINQSIVTDSKYNNIDKKSGLYFLQNNTQRLEHLLATTYQAIAKNNPSIIIFPTVDELSNFYFSLDKNLQNQIDIFTNQSSKSQTWSLWQRAAHNDFKLILATRSGVFLPTTPTVMVIDQIERLEYKQTDMNPRYNLLDIIQQRFIFDKNFVGQFLSFSPKVDVYTSLKKLNININISQPLSSRIRFITQTSNEAKFEFIENLTNNRAKNIFIFLNRKGQFNSFICAECNWTPKCPIDNTWLKQHHSVLRCHDCGYTEPETFKCPQCASTKLIGSGIGTKNIELLLKKLSTNFNIYRLDSDNAVECKKTKIDFTKKNIIIGTEYALTKINLAVFTDIIFFNADTDLLFTDYLSSERTLNLYQRIIKQVSSSAQIIINTADPDNTFWSELNNNITTVINKDLKNRRKFLYPPFSKITKLIYTATNEALVKKITTDMYHKLKAKNLSDFEILPPKPNKPYREYKKYYVYILVKAKRIDLSPILSELDDKWLVDRDPQKL